MKRECAGWYRTEIAGHKVEIVKIDPKEAGDKGTAFWNVIIDGLWDNDFDSKLNAMRYIGLAPEAN